MPSLFARFDEDDATGDDDAADQLDGGERFGKEQSCCDGGDWHFGEVDEGAEGGSQAAQADEVEHVGGGEHDE